MIDFYFRGRVLPPERFRVLDSCAGYRHRTVLHPSAFRWIHEDENLALTYWIHEDENLGGIEANGKQCIYQVHSMKQVGTSIRS
jgi:hypothetical protein